MKNYVCRKNLINYAQLESKVAREILEACHLGVKVTGNGLRKSFINSK
jgi:hypothetical protein